MAVSTLGAIELSIANMEKEVRNRKEEVYVSSFVPEYKVPNKQPMSLDPFLEPLVAELEDLFVNGKNLVYLFKDSAQNY